MRAMTQRLGTVIKGVSLVAAVAIAVAIGVYLLTDGKIAEDPSLPPPSTLAAVERLQASDPQRGMRVKAGMVQYRHSCRLCHNRSGRGGNFTPSLARHNADSVIVMLGALSQCRSDATCDINDNGAPFFDNVRFGVFDPAGLAMLSNTLDRFADNFPTSNTGFPLTATNRTDASYSLAMQLGAENPLRWVRADSAATAIAAPNTAVYLKWAVERGACQPNLMHPFFVAFPPTAPGTYPNNLTWHAARMDTAQSLDPENPPKDEKTSEGIEVIFMDHILQRPLAVTPDFLVLSPGLQASDTADLSTILKAARTQEGFFMEAHVKLRPVDMAADGFYLCGTAHGPKLISETIAQAQAAAARAGTLLALDSVALSAITAKVITEYCVKCLTCVRSCPFSVPQFNIDTKEIEINEALCRGCGVCTAVCPRQTII